MEKEDFDKILRNVANYDVDWKTGKVSLKAQPNAIVSDKMARVVKMSHVLYNACSHVKAFSDEKLAENYARNTFNAMLPFFNDFEKLIKDSYAHSTGIHANDIESLMEKHEEDFKHFYAVTDTLLAASPTHPYLQAFVEHALDKDVEKVEVDFSQTTRKVSYVSKVGIAIKEKK